MMHMLSIDVDDVRHTMRHDGDGNCMEIGNISKPETSDTGVTLNISTVHSTVCPI